MLSDREPPVLKDYGTLLGVEFLFCFSLLVTGGFFPIVLLRSTDGWVLETGQRTVVAAWGRELTAAAGAQLGPVSSAQG